LNHRAAGRVWAAPLDYLEITKWHFQPLIAILKGDRAVSNPSFISRHQQQPQQQQSLEKLQIQETSKFNTASTQDIFQQMLMQWRHRPLLLQPVEVVYPDNLLLQTRHSYLLQDLHLF